MDLEIIKFFQEFDLINFFEQYAYAPYSVYAFVFLFMTASSFGLPIPEEVTLVSVGLVAYMARNPDLFPPPTPDAEGVNLTLLCIVCFLAVLGSDVLIYFLGKFFGGKIMKTKFFAKKVQGKHFDKINLWFQKYSFWVSGIFRFTPGLRFPGHMSCGMLGVPLWKFMLVDGLAALVSVPTQVLAVAFYGQFIIEYFKYIKIGLFIIILGVVSFLLIKKYFFTPKTSTKLSS